MTTRPPLDERFAEIIESEGGPETLEALSRAFESKAWDYRHTSFGRALQMAHLAVRVTADALREALEAGKPQQQERKAKA